MKTQFRLVRRWEMVTVCLMLLWTLPAQSQPVNDMFADRTVLSGTNTVVMGSSVDATTETGEPDLDYEGGASVWWSWTAPFAGTATISTAGSNFDTMLGVYTGSAVSALTEIAGNDQDGGLYTSRVQFDTVSNRTYQIVVDGYEGASGTVRLSVQLGPLQPAPAWALPDPYWRMVYSSNYAGKVIILDFWATWCGPCKVGMPDLVALQAKYGNDGLAVIGANVSWSEESVQTVRTFLATWTPQVNYQVVMSDAATEDAFGTIYSIPTTFIIDRHNILRKQYVGVTDGATLERQILPLLYNAMKLTAMELTLSGNNMVLSWPITAATFTLDSTTDLTDPTWSAWPVDPIWIWANGTKSVLVPATGHPRYFRLRMQ